MKYFVFQVGAWVHYALWPAGAAAALQQLAPKTVPAAAGRVCGGAAADASTPTGPAQGSASGHSSHGDPAKHWNQGKDTSGILQMFVLQLMFMSIFPSSNFVNSRMLI